MQALLTVILPVFLIIGFGYAAVWRGWFPESGADALMKFTQNFAIPCLLFSAITGLDLGQEFDLAMLGAFYAGALGGFFAAMFAARFVFRRDWPDSVAIGFIGLFSNSVLLGLPITERAYGAEALASNYMIIALHAPFCYGVGITAMEIARNAGGTLVSSVPRILRAMFRNALVIAIGLGFIVNLGHIPLPGPLTDALALMSRAALPVALFGLGGVLVRYRPEGDMRLVLVVVAISLVLHPAITWSLAHLLEVGPNGFRSAVLTAAMAPGVNAYVFANMYGVGKRIAASSVLIATGLTVVTGWLWLMALP